MHSLGRSTVLIASILGCAVGGASLGSRSSFAQVGVGPGSPQPSFPQGPMPAPAPAPFSPAPFSPAPAPPAPAPAPVPPAPAVPAPSAPAPSSYPYPKRKAGLWEVKTTAGQAAGLPPTLFCVGAETDNEKVQLDRIASKEGACEFGSFRKVGNGWFAEAICKEGKTVITSRSLASGNFETEYRIDTFITYQPPVGASNKKEDKEALVATYAGDCRAGQRVGEMFVPGMGYISMIDGKVRPIPEPRARRAVKKKPPNR